MGDVLDQRSADNSREAFGGRTRSTIFFSSAGVFLSPVSRLRSLPDRCLRREDQLTMVSRSHAASSLPSSLSALLATA